MLTHRRRCLRAKHTERQRPRGLGPWAAICYKVAKIELCSARSVRPAGSGVAVALRSRHFTLAQGSIQGWAILRRIVRVALRNYWTVAASVLCCLVVAALWGGNIGFLYPIVEVVGMKQSLGQWVDTSISTAEKTIAEQTAIAKQIEAKLAQAPVDDRRAIASELRAVTNRREAAAGDLQRSKWLKPWIDAYLPDDPFRTLAVYRGPAAGGHDHQGHVPGAQLVSGQSRGATGHVRSAQGVLSPHAAAWTWPASTKAARATC